MLSIKPVSGQQFGPESATERPYFFANIGSGEEPPHLLVAADERSGSTRKLLEEAATNRAFSAGHTAGYRNL